MYITDNPTPAQIKALEARLRRDRHAPIVAISGPLVTAQLIAVEAGAPLGIASISDGEAEAELYKLYIVPEAQGRGVGKALFNAVLVRARKQRMSALNIEMAGQSYLFWEKVTVGLQIVALGQERFSIVLDD